MIMIRLSKTILVASIALFATLVAFGNITDYDTNFAFVRHVLMMDTLPSDAAIVYRAIYDLRVHHAAYIAIIAAETLTALLCWIGAFTMLSRISARAADFNRAKTWAVAGLTMGVLLWYVGFESIGGEWFGMWMSSEWNGVESAFRFVITIIAVLIFVSMPDTEPGQ